MSYIKTLFEGCGDCEYNKVDEDIDPIQYCPGCCQKIIDFWESHPQKAEFGNRLRLHGLDISPCLRCGNAVLCVPDGMPMCDPCAKKEMEDSGMPSVPNKTVCDR